MPDSQIFKATYSGVPVYEMMCKGVAVMRRRSDGWLNATQILKVAGFDKPQRTRVLERDIQKGEHEKVQGGYGKYQGTWIPLDRALTLAKQYQCEHILKPIIDFQPEAKSPPLAPKHLVAPISGRPPARRAAPEAPSVAASTRSTRRVVHPDAVSDDISMRGSEDGSMSPIPSDASTSSPTPPPIHETPDPPSYEPNIMNENSYLQSPRTKTRKTRRSAQRAPSESDGEPQSNGFDGPQSYCDEILEYFISDTNQIPQVLINPPVDFDPNMAIDDDGHTALHWASAMGRVRVVKLLLTAGADIFKVNKSGQTALMRSVMFANNYDVRKFPELYELLHRSTLNIDNFNRTVFHHIVDVAMTKGKTHAARYYMETILQRLAEYPKELADIINFQDEDGETALTMAARCRSKRLVKLLIDHGADPKIMNRDSKSTEDYILEDERFRSSPVLPSRTANMAFRNTQVVQHSQPGAHSTYSFAPANGDKPPLHHSVTAQRASTRCINDMAVMLDSLAASFDQELKDKERDMNQAQSLLGNIQSEILESQRAVSQLKTQAQGLEDAKEQLKSLEESFRVKMGKRYRLGWEKWIRDEEERERAVRESPNGQSLPNVPEVLDGVEASEVAAVLGALKEKGKGKRKLGDDEDISDLQTIYTDLPTDPEAIESACRTIRDELEQHKKRRTETFDEYVKLQAEAGTSGRMNQYRRLIAAGCGGISPAEVDGVLGMLLETLEAEEPSASLVTWSRMPSSRPGVAVS
ncbi:apses-domain-containing protein [Rickenella mellea]|uniref:Apses-domain-containing protein n=1 Tax=Rickenella mellea TaxID=50990 RepID=A0A4R5XFJ2_9AGAM|nr:apses-domain-containing protein [Rickenella mellea]